jgi:hypothetical protein
MQLMNDPAERERQLQKEMSERRLQLEQGMAPKRHSTLTREEKIERGIPLSYGRTYTRRLNPMIN